MRKAKGFIALTLFALFVLVYAHTCSLSVSWKNFSEDSGDLLAAACTLGIPHPTGYPLYVLLGRLFSLIMPGSVAFRITLLSLLCASAASVLLFLTVARLLRGRGALLGATLSALSLGFSLHFWSQAVVAEVYALHILLTSLVVYLLLKWSRADELTDVISPGHRDDGVLLSGEGTTAALNGGYCETSEGWSRRESSAYLLLAAYALGLSFTNHMLSVVTLVFAAVFVLSGSGRKRLSFPLCLLALVFMAVPFTLYAYLPIRSMRNPHLDWGNPETWEQLKWVVTGEQYRFRLLATPVIQAFSRLWPGPFLAAGWLVGVFSLVGLLWGRLSVALRAALTAAIAVNLAIVTLYEIPDFPAYFLPACFALSFLAGAGFQRVLDASVVFLERMRRPALMRYGTALAATVLLLAAILPPARNNRKETDVSADFYPYVFGRATFRAVEPNALIVSEYDGRTFALWFFRETEFRETHADCVVVFKYLLVWPWYIDNLTKLYPDLSVPEAGHMDTAMLSLVASNVDRRPVYAVRDDPALKPFFDLRPVVGGETPLFRVERKKPHD